MAIQNPFLTQVPSHRFDTGASQAIGGGIRTLFNVAADREEKKRERRLQDLQMEIERAKLQRTQQALEKEADIAERTEDVRPLIDRASRISGTLPRLKTTKDTGEAAAMLSGLNLSAGSLLPEDQFKGVSAPAEGSALSQIGGVDKEQEQPDVLFTKQENVLGLGGKEEDPQKTAALEQGRDLKTRTDHLTEEGKGLESQIQSNRDLEIADDFLSEQSDKIGGGRSATATRLQVAKDNPELVELAKKRVEENRASNRFTPDFLEDQMVLASVDPLRVLDNLSMAGRPAASRVDVLGETTGLEANLSREKSRATAEGKIEGGRLMTAGELENVTSADKGIARIEAILNKFDDKFVGAIEGRVGSFKERLGLIGMDEGEFRGTMLAHINQNLKDFSGTAVSAQEFARILNEAGNFSQPADVFVAKLKAQLDKLKREKELYLKNLEERGNVRVDAGVKGKPAGSSTEFTPEEEALFESLF
jgi:hypothetical protein